MRQEIHSMNSGQTRTCQNCKAQFVIEPEDFQFYEKIQVPPPTFCLECRMVRRFVWRNERTLHKAKCGLCGADMFSMYRPESQFPVYCRECWYSDKWDPFAYGMAYDFSEPFFVQFQELMRRVPRLHLWQRNAVNTPYANFLGEAKNVYLAYSTVGSEEVYYSKNTDHSREIYDSLNTMDSERCYGNVFGTKNYETHLSFFTRSCLDSAFLFDCVNCKHCFMSANLRNKTYVIRNRQYSKEAYEAEMKDIDLQKHSVFSALATEFEELRRRSLHRYANIIKSVHATGDVLSNAKNAAYCFDAYDLEDCKYIFRTFSLKDCMDAMNTIQSELVYEYTSGGRNIRNTRFSKEAIDTLNDVDYTDHCASSTQLFGCIGVRNAEHCILNKRYTKEEYGTMRRKVIVHMNEMPYISRVTGDTGQATREIVYKYGEFFPLEFSPFAYNETAAQEYFPLEKDEALRRGYAWRDPDVRSPRVDVAARDLPDNLFDTGDDITQKTISCLHEGRCVEQCTMAFRVIPSECAMYRRVGLPLPRLCPNCRHYERSRMRNPLKLWHRQCACDYATYPNTTKHAHHPEGRCPNEFETSYAPDRKEIVYCESCYNSEVV